MPIDQQKPQDLKKRPLNDYMKYAAMSFQLAFIVFLFTYGGIKIDHYLGMKFPVFTLVLCFFSIAAALYLTLKDLIKK